MTTNPPKPTPLDYGFASDFEDLSSAQPKSASPTVTVSVAPPVSKSIAKPVLEPKKAALPRPTRPKGQSAGQKRADQLAKQHGFASREPQTQVLLKKRRRTHHDEPVDQLSIRGPVRVLNDFIEFCDDQGVSYWEGLEKLIHESSPASKK